MPWRIPIALKENASFLKRLKALLSFRPGVFPSLSLMTVPRAPNNPGLLGYRQVPGCSISTLSVWNSSSSILGGWLIPTVLYKLCWGYPYSESLPVLCPTPLASFRSPCYLHTQSQTYSKDRMPMPGQQWMPANSWNTSWLLSAVPVGRFLVGTAGHALFLKRLSPSLVMPFPWPSYPFPYFFLSRSPCNADVF